MIKEEALAHGSNFPKISHLILISACVFWFFFPSFCLRPCSKTSILLAIPQSSEISQKLF